VILNFEPVCHLELGVCDLPPSGGRRTRHREKRAHAGSTARPCASRARGGFRAPVVERRNVTSLGSCLASDGAMKSPQPGADQADGVGAGQTSSAIRASPRSWKAASTRS